MPDENMTFIEERLQLMEEACELIDERMSFIHTASDFVSKPEGVMRMDSIALRLQTIGENVKKIERISPEFLAQYTSINWNLVIRFRDLIAHHYEKADYEVLFDICTHHLTPLKKVIATMLHDIALQR
jgi:uncharacterized protein with HEPN domain